MTARDRRQHAEGRPGVARSPWPRSDSSGITAMGPASRASRGRLHASERGADVGLGGGFLARISRIERSRVSAAETCGWTQTGSFARSTLPSRPSPAPPHRDASDAWGNRSPGRAAPSLIVCEDDDRDRAALRPKPLVQASDRCAQTAAAVRRAGAARGGRAPTRADSFDTAQMTSLPSPAAAVGAALRSLSTS